MPICITYRRVSTDDQAREGQSLEAQREALLRWAAANAQVVAAEFADEGVSAWSTRQRAGLAEALIYCRDHKVDILAVYSIDRFSRDLQQNLLLRSEFARYGVKVVSITEAADTDSPEGRLLAGMLGGMAQYFSDQSSAKIRVSMMHKAKKGGSCGGRVPYGYTLDNGVYLVNEAEAVGVRLAFDLAERGYGALQISRALNERALYTHAGRQWSKCTVAAVLRNPVYYGARVWGKKQGHKAPGGRVNKAQQVADWVVVENSHAPIISKSQFDAVRAATTERGFSKRQARTRGGSDWLLSKLLCCAHCGHAYSGSSKNKGGKVYRYYVCMNNIKRGSGACVARRWLPAEDVEAALLQAVRGFVFSPQNMQALRAAVVDALAQSSGPSALAEAERGLADVEARINRVLSACETGALSNDEVAARMIPLRSDKLRLKAAVEAARASSADAVADLETIMADLQKSFSETFGSLPMPEQQAAIRAIVGRIEVDQIKDEMTVYFGLPESKRPELSSSLSAINPSGELGKTWWPKSHRVSNYIPVKVALPPSKGRRDLSAIPPSPVL